MNQKRTFIILLIAACIICFLGGYYWHAKGITKPSVEKGIDTAAVSNSNMPLDTMANYLPDVSHDIYLRIYGYDDFYSKDLIDYFIRVSGKATFRDRLEFLASRISLLEFGGNPIKLSSIEERNGLRIAIIDLVESDNPNSRSWRTGYFQGSAGGGVTSRVLINSFLQRDYEGEWVDGVEFYYEGKPISQDDWDHIFLNGVKLRKK